MKYLEFKKKVEAFPVIQTSQLGFFEKDPQLMRNQLTRWEKKGWIIKLKKGLYVLNESDRKMEPSRMFLANQLYSPSYISTEYALGFYDLIPERVADITSITARKTYKVKNIFGEFIYQHINVRAYTGFNLVRDENHCNVMVASPEKAIVDFLYLNLYMFKKDDLDVFEESYRFQNLDQLRKKRIEALASYFNNKKLMIIVRNFFHSMKKK